MVLSLDTGKNLGFPAVTWTPGCGEREPSSDPSDGESWLCGLMDCVHRQLFAIRSFPHWAPPGPEPTLIPEKVASHYLQPRGVDFPEKGWDAGRCNHPLMGHFC